MRGLAFPANAPADREPSYEYGTPISNVDDIPIDPALGGAAIDPALMMQEESTSVVPVDLPPVTLPEHKYLQHEQPLPDEYQIRQYSQGPQGDPFAPQIPAPYFPPIEQEQPQPPPPPKPKRKRKVYREEKCSFCQGKEMTNKHGEQESMLTCHECGRSGHPSCMELEKLGPVVRSYQWKCIECKNCEVCQEKGDDDRILFCDCCDRGWHMDCIQPPIDDAPEGEWHCPLCPPIMEEGEEPLPDQYSQSGDAHQSPMESGREPSVASSSRSVIEVQPPSTRAKNKRGRGRARAKARPKALAVSDCSDNEDAQETPMISRGRGRPPKGSTRGKARAVTVTSDGEPDPTPARAPRRKRPREPSPSSPQPRVRLRIPPQRGRGKGKEREEEGPHGLFDDLLGIEDRDTAKTTPVNLDKLYFERSRISAEEKLAPPPPTASSSRTRDANTNDHSTPLHSRPLRSATIQHLSTPKLLDINSFSNSPGPSTPGGPLPLPKFEPGVLRIRSIRFGPYDIKTWYDAPFPEEYASIPDGRLWICEFCLKYMKSRFKAIRHQMKCKVRHPPGDEIYRDGSVSIFEVDGRRNKIYCQNLCLLSKMFLDHKSLFYDVEPFLFYVITQVDDFGARFVGYFSKEKRCPKDYNLSCIMTLPVRQRQGWGNLLIDFSYLLSKIEQRSGSPEKPLSSLGALGYKNYWTLALMRYLEKAPDNVRLEDISAATSMTIEDVCNTLVQQNMVFIREATPPPIRPSPGQSIKFPKGRKNGIARRQLQRLQTQDKLSLLNLDADGHSKGPFVAPKHYEIHFERQKVEAYLKKWESKGYLKLRPEKLQWTPYLVTRTTQEAAVAVDLPAMDTIPDEPSKTASDSVITGQSVEPITPGPINGHGMLVDSPVPEAEVVAEKGELPMLVDDSSPEPGPRTRTRSSIKSPTKERGPPRVTRAISLPSSPPPPPPSRSLRTRSSHLNAPSPAVDASSSGPGRSTRKSNPNRRSGRKGLGEVGDDDEVLAAKLAMEEQTPGRTLRSGRTDQVENKRPVPVTPRAPSARKRRRIESSPEVEESPVPEPEPSEPEAKPEEVNGAVPSPVEANGDAHSPVEVNGDGPSPVEVNVPSPVEDVPMAVDCDVPPPPKVNGNHEPLALDTPVDVINTSIIAKAPVVLNKHEVDVKSEDRGTPLTSLTSRQSLPSDDTIFMEGPNKFADYHGAVHAESDLRSTLVPHGIVDLDDCHDEDADGEYEEDDGDVLACYS